MTEGNLQEVERLRSSLAGHARALDEARRILEVECQRCVTCPGTGVCNIGKAIKVIHEVNP